MIHSDNADQYYDKVIHLHLQGLGSKKISRVIPVSRATISRWVRKFAEERYCSVKMSRHLTDASISGNIKTPLSQSNKEMTSKSRQNTEPKGLTKGKREIDADSILAENEKLRELLRQASLRADALDEMINVAEKQLNVSIRKKAGAKQ